jgi:hypothetical protein
MTATEHEMEGDYIIRAILLNSSDLGRPPLRVPGDRDHWFQTIVITGSRAS